MSVSRRGLLSVLGLASAAIGAPLATGAALLNPGRSITYLPGGGMLIEDEQFSTGIKLENCQNLTIEGCIITTANAAQAGIKID